MFTFMFTGVTIGVTMESEMEKVTMIKLEYNIKNKSGNSYILQYSSFEYLCDYPVYNIILITNKNPLPGTINEITHFLFP